MFYCIHVLFYSISLCPISLYYVLLCLFHFIIIFYFNLFFYYFVTIKVFSCKMFYSVPYHSVKIYSIIFSSSIVFYWPLSSFMAATAELPILPLSPSLPKPSPSGSRGVGVRPLRFCWFGGLGSVELVGSRFRSRATISADLRWWTPSMSRGDSGSGQSVSQNLSQQES